MYPLWSILGCETARDGGRVCGLGWGAGHNASHARHSTHSRDAAAVIDGATDHISEALPE